MYTRRFFVYSMLCAVVCAVFLFPLHAVSGTDEGSAGPVSNDSAASTGGKIIFDFTAMHAFLSVVTDSRNVRPNSLFVPLRGESRDGHLYIEEALKNGACCFFCDYKFLEEKNEKLCRRITLAWHDSGYHA